MKRIKFTLVACFATACLCTVSAQQHKQQYGASQNPAPLSLEQEIKRVEAEIDKIFADTLAELPSIPNDTSHRMKRIQTLGKLELFDKQLSVNRNTACTFCHMPSVDFTGPISMLNATTVSYPGSVRNKSAA